LARFFEDVILFHVEELVLDVILRHAPATSRRPVFRSPTSSGCGPSSSAGSRSSTARRRAASPVASTPVRRLLGFRLDDEREEHREDRGREHGDEEEQPEIVPSCRRYPARESREAEVHREEHDDDDTGDTGDLGIGRITSL
jgi:hypothetical protein